MDSPTSIMIKFAGSIDLLSINLKSTNGYLERLSTTINNMNEIIPPVIRNGSSEVEELEELLLLVMLVAVALLPPDVSMNVNTSRNKVIVAAKVTAPFTSI